MPVLKFAELHKITDTLHHYPVSEAPQYVTRYQRDTALFLDTYLAQLSQGQCLSSDQLGPMIMEKTFRALAVKLFHLARKVYPVGKLFGWVWRPIFPKNSK